jgi:uncharacterized protein YndB with AHSA1/START domain
MANHSKVTVTIDRPAEMVWDKLMDPDNLKHWLTGFVSAEHVSGQHDKPGAVSKLRFKEGGREMEVMETVTALEPHQRYAFTMNSTAFDVDTDIRLVSFGSRTEMIQTVQFFPKQFFMKLLMPVMKGAMKKRTEKELVKFKEFVERG